MRSNTTYICIGLTWEICIDLHLAFTDRREHHGKLGIKMALYDITQISDSRDPINFQAGRQTKIPIRNE